MLVRFPVSLAIWVLVACGPREPESGPQVPQLIATAEGFDIPESVRFDPVRDVMYVSNVTGNPTAKDNNGFISRLRPDGTVDSLRFIAGGRDGVELHSPKGMFLAGDTLWVADIDVVRSFDVATGAALSTVDLAPGGAIFLNDITRAPDGSFYVSDTRFVFSDSGVRHESPDRIYRVAVDGGVSVAIEGDTLGMPNGVLWDAEANRLLIVAIGRARIHEWRPGDAAPRLVAAGPGGYDGIESLGGGRFILTAQDDSSVSILADGAVTAVVRNLPSPGDLGWDPGRRRVMVPLLDLNQVQVWSIP